MQGRRAERTKWDDLRAKLGLGEHRSWGLKPHDRAWTAQQLGVGRRTIERYELHDEAPEWYGMALVGLAVKLETVKISGPAKTKA
jgi:hypothetical protein